VPRLERLPENAGPSPFAAYQLKELDGRKWGADGQSVNLPQCRYWVLDGLFIFFPAFSFGG
jgi:hypothetical protein